MIRPQTAMATLRGVARVHKRNHLELIPLKHLALPLKGLMRKYVAQFGPTSLVPKRREPLTNPMIAKLLRLPDGQYGRKQMNWDSLLGLSVRGAVELASQTGFRKVELFESNSETDFMHWDNVAWRVNGTTVSAASITLVEILAYGVGCTMVVRSPRSKADQLGTVWSALPLFLQWKSAGISAARALQLIAIKRLQAGLDLKGPVFTTDANVPLTESSMRDLLFHMLCSFLPAELAKLYTWHSFRIYLACALLAADVAPKTIQMLLRWQTEESLAVYARMGQEAYHKYLEMASRAVVSSVQTKNLPITERFDMFLAMNAAADALSE